MSTRAPAPPYVLRDRGDGQVDVIADHTSPDAGEVVFEGIEPLAGRAFVLFANNEHLRRELARCNRLALRVRDIEQGLHQGGDDAQT